MIHEDFKIKTDGGGLWSSAVKTVKVTAYEVQDYDGFGELMVYFDTRTWNVDKLGLIYTDRAFEAGLKSRLTELGYDVSDVSYSEQGMQGDNYVSLDVGPAFLETWRARQNLH